MLAKYYSINPANFKLDGGAMFGIIPRPLWSKKAVPDEQNRISLSLRILCIEVGKRLILIDTGIGDYHSQKFNEQFAITSPSDPLIAALNLIGKDPDEVTDLILSHLHFDHVGGLACQKNDVLEASFKNAIYHLHKDHFDYAQNPTERDAGSFLLHTFLPLIEKKNKENKVHWCEGQNGIILKEGNYQLNFRTSHGHTPYLMHAYDQEWIYLADLIPTSSHLHIPWVMGYDIAPGVSTKDKRAILKFIFENKLKLFFEHDPEYFGASIKCQIKNNKEEYNFDQLYKPPSSSFQITPASILGQ